tara:strand:+ start:2702 stop:3034 length:333 start_codon:yes stop_codon:yes gene_type:complete
MACTDIPEYDFSLFKGDDKTKKFRYKAGGEVVDITGYIIQLETNIISLQKTASIPDPVTGEFNFVFAKADTGNLTEKRVKYKVVYYPTGLLGDKVTKFTGSINLNSKGIT